MEMKVLLVIAVPVVILALLASLDSPETMVLKEWM